jgi:ribosomal protein L29
MEYKEIKKKKVSELHNLLAETRDKLRELRFKDANKQLKNVREIRVLKKTISKILTVLNNEESAPKVEAKESK